MYRKETAMSKRIYFKIILSVMFFVFASSYIYSEEVEYEYKEYKIVKGDTLWDISSKEIQNPFLWPKIWKENPEIKNPDRIYPDHAIKIPLRLLEKEQIKLEEATAEKKAAIPEPTKIETLKEEPMKVVERKIEPVKKNYIADKDLIISSGYITDYITAEVKSIGKIIGAPTGRTLFGGSDYVYVKTDAPVNTGDKFYIIRLNKFIKHPVTKNKLGYLIEVLGVTEIVGIENEQTKAKITKSYNDVRTGDLLDTFYEVESVMEEETPRKPDVKGFIVAIRQMKSIGGQMDILFIDKGSNNGLEIGDMLKTVSIDKHNNSIASGIIQIISLRSSTATAIVRRSESTISAGDEVVGVK